MCTRVRLQVQIYIILVIITFASDQTSHFPECFCNDQHFKKKKKKCKQLMTQSMRQ